MSPKEGLDRAPSQVAVRARVELGELRGGVRQKEVLAEAEVTELEVCLPDETPFWSIGCSFLDGGLVVSSVADSSTEFDVRQANSYAIVEGEKERVDEQEGQERQ